MATFTYKAVEAGSKKIHGTVEANGKRDAIARLSNNGLILVHIAEIATTRSRQNLKAQDLYTFTLELSVLLRAGIPLYESLDTIQHNHTDDKKHALYLAIAKSIKKGSSLANALTEHPETFDNRYCAIVYAGETTGTLEQALEQLSSLLNKQIQLQRKLSTAMIYPAILATCSLFVVAILLLFVVPAMEPIIGQGSSHILTRIVVALSHLITSYWHFLLGGLALLSLTVVSKLYRKQTRSLLFNKIALRLPILKTVALQNALLRFFNTMATLLAAGVPFLDSLRLSRGTLGFAPLERLIQKAEQGVLEGRSLSNELALSLLIPPMIKRMIAVGESSGNMGGMMNEISQMQQTQLEKSLNRITQLAQPVLIFTMGVVVAIVMLAILLPLTEVGTILHME
ncbi:type II secretion system F family protein [Simkania negevensis]|uniref:General secretion pathway protein F n=1 Tax=Simkania negevensis TaxID=83561 RepID=A0ABS3ARX8_9BACT|nr:type II secretion system F family protein [Simkania negevensis]